jgi:hypothetical protein
MGFRGVSVVYLQVAAAHSRYPCTCITFCGQMHAWLPYPLLLLPTHPPLYTVHCRLAKDGRCHTHCCRCPLTHPCTLHCRLAKAWQSPLASKGMNHSTMLPALISTATLSDLLLASQTLAFLLLSIACLADMTDIASGAVTPSPTLVPCIAVWPRLGNPRSSVKA